MHLSLRILTAAVMIVQAASHANIEKGKHMEATGTFELKVTPAEATAFEKGMGVTRYEIRKAWEGEFKGASRRRDAKQFHRKYRVHGLRRHGTHDGKARRKGRELQSGAQGNDDEGRLGFW